MDNLWDRARDYWRHDVPFRLKLMVGAVIVFIALMAILGGF